MENRWRDMSLIWPIECIEKSLNVLFEENQIRIGGVIDIYPRLLLLKIFVLSLDFNILSFFMTYVCGAHGSLLVIL